MSTLKGYPHALCGHGYQQENALTDLQLKIQLSGQNVCIDPIDGHFPWEQDAEEANLEPRVQVSPDRAASGTLTPHCRRRFAEEIVCLAKTPTRQQWERPRWHLAATGLLSSSAVTTLFLFTATLSKYTPYTNKDQLLFSECRHNHISVCLSKITVVPVWDSICFCGHFFTLSIPGYLVSDAILAVKFSK